MNPGIKNHRSLRCIRLIVAKFKLLRIVADRQYPDRSRTGRIIDNIESARQDITYNPRKSVRRRSEEHQIFKTDFRRILREDLKCYSYTIQLVQKSGQN